MVSKLLKLMKNKWIFALCIVVTCVLIFDVSVIVFDIIQIAVIQKNAAKLSGMFVGINVATICLNVFCSLLILTYYLVRKFSKINM